MVARSLRFKEEDRKNKKSTAEIFKSKRGKNNERGKDIIFREITDCGRTDKK